MIPEKPEFRCQCRGGPDICSCHVYGTTYDCPRCQPDVMRRPATEKEHRRQKFERHRGGA
jgi:hypothetical protein